MLRRRWPSSRHDRDIHHGLESSSIPLPDGVRLSWLGTSGFVLESEGLALLIDPYVTRVGVGELASRRPLRSDSATVASVVAPGTEVAGVLIGHTHFDHALDAAEFVRIHRCGAFGSSSLRQLLGLHGLAEYATEVEPDRHYEIGPFTVRFVRSVHSKLLAGVAVPSAGELSCEHLDHLTGREFRCGEVYGIHIEIAGTTIYHQGSADFSEDDLRTGPVDIFLAGIAGRAFSRNYFERILPRLDPSCVVPTHYDNFLRPQDGQIDFLLNVNLSRWVDDMERLSRDVTLATLSRWRPADSG